MEDALSRFHTFKDVFSLGTAGKEVEAKANSLRMEVVKMQKIDNNTIAETWTPSNKWCEMNAWRDYISLKIDVSKQIYADFNFPKIDLGSHQVEQIRRYGALQQYSA